MSTAHQQSNIDTLLLLIGENPLPNYVAAKLLAQPGKTTIWLLHSEGTRPQKDALYKQLTNQGHVIQVEEIADSDPTSIQKAIKDRFTKLQGVHVHYTGGTKSMAVNIMRALGEVASSYLDARQLMLWVEEPGQAAVSTVVQMHVRLTVEDILELHSMADLAGTLRRSVILQHTTQALAYVHSDKTERAEWQEWINKTVREARIKNRNDKEVEMNADVPLISMPFKKVLQAIQEDIQTDVLPETLGTLLKILKPDKTWPFKKPNQDLRKWFEGGWLEEYTFREIQKIQDVLSITDLCTNINPKLSGLPGKDNKFEVDVAFTRGYQLYGISCTTAGKEFLKHKLLEAIIRARQLGGGEARIALVSCASSDEVQLLQYQAEDLFQKGILRVFGENDLLQLSDCLKSWVKESSAKGV